VGASVGAFAFHLWPGPLVAPGVSPFLYGIIAVIAVALGAGPGPGIVATVISAVWCGVDPGSGNVASTAFSCVLFVGAGGFLSRFTAVSARKLRESIGCEQWYRSLADASGEGIWVLDENCLIVYANARMEEILGLRAGEALGRSPEHFFFAEDLPVERVRLRNLIAGHKAQFDRRLRRKDGSEAWVLSSSTQLPGRAGVFASGALSVMTDITERKQTEQALRRSEQRFRSLFENVQEGVYQTSPEGRVLQANPALLRMLGISSDAEIHELKVEDVYADPNLRKRLIRRLESEGSFQNVEYQLRRRDGKVIIVQENARVVRGDDGQALYYEGTLNDVTNIRNSESELVKATQMTAISELTSTTTREFNGFLARISEQAELLTEHEAAPLTRGCATDILKSVKSAAGLAEQLVSFARPSAGPSTVDLNRLLVECESLFRGTAAGVAEISIVRDTSGAIPVHIDRAHIELIALRMLLYALETLNPGSPVELSAGTIEFGSITAEQVLLSGRARPGVFAAISVAGDGWDPLRGRQNKTGAETRSVLAHVVDQYDSFSFVETREDGWARLSVCFPRAANMVYAPNSRETILLVDDDLLVRELSRDLLEMEGYRVLCAGDAVEAERLAAESAKFSLLVTDVVMPDVSGTALARKIRESRPDLKVLFISGFAAKQIDDGTLRKEDAFLAKPFSPGALARKLREVLDGPEDGARHSNLRVDKEPSLPVD